MTIVRIVRMTEDWIEYQTSVITGYYMLTLGYSYTRSEHPCVENMNRVIEQNCSQISRTADRAVYETTLSRRKHRKLVFRYMKCKLDK
jgi:hypothetical protein